VPEIASEVLARSWAWAAAFTVGEVKRVKVGVEIVREQFPAGAC
jgi:hypothetical protein